MTVIDRAEHDCALRTPHPPDAGGLDRAAREICRYYQSRGSVATLLVLNFTLSYLGGAFFFWVHAIMRGERGPQIAHWQHWLVDSSIAFIGLLPPLAVLLPLSRVAASRMQQHFPAAPVTALRILCLGIPFALVTAAGPLVHDLLVGEDTLAANWLTQTFGPTDGRSLTTPGTEHAAVHSGGHLADVGVQLALGVPVYTLLVTAALLLTCRHMCGRGEHAGR